jgi:phenylalanyl-tRNA synthetase beta chain
VESALAVARAVGVAVVVEPETDHAPWHPGRCARVELTDGTLVGHAGELHPKTLAALGLPARTVALELDVEELTRASEATTRYHEISAFPAALTDVALVVADTVTAAQVERSLRKGAGDFLEEVALFDAYAGEQVGDGRTSLAYRLTFRAPDRTLTTEEVNEFRDAAVASAGEAVGAVQRT